MVDNYYSNHWKACTEELTKKSIFTSQEADSLKSMINSPDKENLVLAQELLRLKISEAMLKGLNVGQKDAFLKIAAFLQDPGTYSAVVLKGYAGTGKTYLIRRILEYISLTDVNKKIAVTAPTNKAVYVLAKKNAAFNKSAMVFENYIPPSSKITYSTIHKLLNLKEEISDTGVQSFVSANNKNVDILAYQYLFVDETSMLDDILFHNIIKFKDKLRIIFMGDPAQIPPINREHCTPFRENSTFDFLKLELTEIMRQQNNHPIIRQSFVIRENLSKRNPIEKYETELNNEHNGIIHINGKTHRSLVRHVIEKFFKDPGYERNTDFVKIIAWRNQTVDYLNTVTRQVLYGKDVEKFVIGDKLVANKALFTVTLNRGIFIDPIYTLKANTSDEFVIKKIDIVEKTFRETVNGTVNYSFKGKFWALDVKRTTDSVNDGFLTNITLFIIHEDSKEEYDALIKKAKTEAKIHSKSNYWIAYYNILKWSDDISYNYAITAHKSQGSTYMNVLLIEEDLNFNPKIVERNRIKYTAYTRATDKLYLLI